MLLGNSKILDLRLLIPDKRGKRSGEAVCSRTVIMVDGKIEVNLCHGNKVISCDHI